jgi:hypothetical protein
MMESSHAKAVDGMDLATAAATRTVGGVVTHLDLFADCNSQKMLWRRRRRMLKEEDQPLLKMNPP